MSITSGASVFRDKGAMTKLAKPRKPKTYKSLVSADHRALHTKAVTVDLEQAPEGLAYIAILINDMLYLMQNLRGISLAAPQVGVSLRICVMMHRDKRTVLINPEIVHSGGKQIGMEGCLTFPGKFVEIERPEFVEVTYLDHDFIARRTTFKDYDARCICHEIDHFEGKLIEDYGELLAS